MCDLETPVIVDMLLFPQIDKHKRPENIYLLYSRRPTTFVFRDRQIDRKGRHRSSESGA